MRRAFNCVPWYGLGDLETGEPILTGSHGGDLLMPLPKTKTREQEEREEALQRSRREAIKRQKEIVEAARRQRLRRAFELMELRESVRKKLRAIGL